MINNLINKEKNTSNKEIKKKHKKNNFYINKNHKNSKSNKDTYLNKLDYSMLI